MVETLNYKLYEITKLSSIKMGTERWFFSTNAKDIGILYLIFALFSGLIGTGFSVLIRLELSGPGVQFISDNQLFNAIVTAHAILMIFFMVEKSFIFNFFSLNSFFYNNRQDDLNADVVIGDSNNNNGDNNNNEFKYVKIVINDPSNNRKLILNNTKNKKGVYVWESLDGENLYVGHSINLYNRISSYFMPSILKTKSRRVLRYLNKYGFNNLKLTIYIMDDNSTLDEVVSLEQHFIDTLNANLNVDPVASSSGYHVPMHIEIREKLRKERGTPIYIYNSEDFSLSFWIKTICL